MRLHNGMFHSELYYNKNILNWHGLLSVFYTHVNSWA